MSATTSSINRLNGSSRMPRGMMISPDIIQFTLACMGAAADWWRIRRKTAQTRLMVTAPMETPAAARGRFRNSSRTAANAIMGAILAAPAAHKLIWGMGSKGMYVSLVSSGLSFQVPLKQAAFIGFDALRIHTSGLPVDADNQGKTHRDFGCGNRQNEKGHHLPARMMGLKTCP